MSRPRMVCRADGQPMAWVFTKGVWLLEPHCRLGGTDGLQWTARHRTAAYYYLNDPKFRGELAGTAMYPGTTPAIAAEVLVWLVAWGEYPPKPVFPAPVGAQPLYGARVGVGS